MEKIIICGDFLTTRIQTQEYHLNWFWILLKRAISSAYNDLRLVKFDGDCQRELNFSRKSFFDKSSIEVDEETTHFYYDLQKIGTESLDQLKQCFSESLIIGYELSIETKKLLDFLAIPYIDIWLHPIRFLDDNFFAYYSNDENVLSVLKENSLKEEIFYLYADKLKVQAFMGFNKYLKVLNSKLKENSCLFVGQTLTDKSVCFKGKMLTVLDFKKQFEDLTKCFDQVYFSLHPMLRGTYQDQLEFLEKFKNVSLISEPAYRLLCSDKIKKVVGISSSVVYEAKFFNKQIEYFYRPAVNVSEELTDYHFISIFGKLHSPEFWTQVLNAFFNERRTSSRIDYLTNKDNYRDMLSLYYNNYVFDKNHLSYLRLEKIQGELKTTKSPKATVQNKRLPYYSNIVNLNRIKEKILAYDIISLDIFDTLLERNLEKASQVIDLVATVAKNKFSVNRTDFIAARKKSRDSFDSDEVRLEDRYKFIGRSLNLDQDVVEQLLKTELKCDENLLKVRKIGLELFNFALANNKKVVLTSDTYYDKDFILHVLTKNSITGFSKIYLSSERNATKINGNLFEIIKKENPGKILHIGDNKLSDYVSATKNQIDSVLLPSNAEQVLNLFKGYVRFNGQLSAIRNGLCLNEMAAFPIVTQKPGYISGSSYKFGYNVVGDLLLNFCLWIKENALMNNVHNLIFFARDGWIVKQIFDIINDTSIKTEYLLASRRSVRLASLFNEADAKNEICDFVDNLKKIDNSVSHFFSHRFGVVFSKQEAAELSHIKNKKDLLDFLSQKNITSRVLENAEEERSAYIDYLKKFGISENYGFVDIGHKGTLQTGIAKLLDLKKSFGFYFATYDGIQFNLGSLLGDHRSFGYLRDKTDPLDVNDLYVKYALIFETIFLHSTGSLIKLEKKNGELAPLFEPVTSEKSRLDFIKNVQKGALKYVNDFIEITNNLNLKPKAFLSGDDASQRLFSILQNPMPWDASIFKDVVIENTFGSRKARKIVTDNEEELNKAIWKEGSQSLINANKRLDKKPSEARQKKDEKSLFTPLKRDLAAGILKFIEIGYKMTTSKNSPKVIKLERNRNQFYRDSKHEFIRKLWLISKIT